MLAFDYAEANHISHRFNKSTKLEGPDWLELFMKRHPNISLRKPEAISLSRVSSFNESNIKHFFENLNDCLNKYKLHDKANKIYYVDETGMTTVQKPSKILGPKGQKQIGSMVSWERGKNVTTICCMNAVGSFVPPRPCVLFLVNLEKMRCGLGVENLDFGHMPSGQD